MGIGNKLAKLLETNETNANELARQIDVSPQTIYSIIKRDSKKADIEVLLKIADVFGVNAEYFVYDNIPDKNSISIPKHDFTHSEIDHMKKYRQLDAHGKEMVDIVLDKEHERVLKIRMQESDLLAAHARTDMEQNSDDFQNDLDLMNDDTKWE